MLLPTPIRGAALASGDTRSAAQGIRPATWIVVGIAFCILVAAHLLAQVKGPHWASPILIFDRLFDLALALLILCYGLALGRKAARPLLGLTDDVLGETLAALGLGIGCLSLGTLFAGFLRLYYAPVILLAAVGLTLWLRHELATICEQGRAMLAQWLRTPIVAAPTAGYRIAFLILVLAFCTVLFRTLAPLSDVDWDALWYHVVGPKQYLIAHRIVPLPGIPLANVPAGEEMLFLLGLFAGSDGLGKLLQALFAVLFGLATFSIGRRVFDRETAWLAVLLLFNAYWLLLFMPAAQTDFAAAFLLLCGIGDTVAWVRFQTRHDRPSAPRHAPGDTTNLDDRVSGEPRLLVRAGLLLGLATSFKLTSAPGLAAAVLVLGLACLFVNDRTVVAGIRLGIVSPAIVGLVALAVLSPWLLKNWYFFHDPFWPTGLHTSNPSDATLNQISASKPTTGGHLQWIVTTFAELCWRFISPLTILLFLAPLVLRRKTERATIGMLLVGALLWFAFIPLLTPRYLLGLIAIADILTAATVVRLLGMLGRRRALLELPLSVYLILNGTLGLLIGLQLVGREGVAGVVLGTVSQSAYLTSTVRFYAAEEYVNGHTATDARIVLVDTLSGFYLARSFLNDRANDRTTYLANSATRASELTEWCRAGARYAILDRGKRPFGQTSIQPRAAFPWLREPGLHAQLLFSQNDVDVFAVQPCDYHAGKGTTPHAAPRS